MDMRFRNLILIVFLGIFAKAYAQPNDVVRILSGGPASANALMAKKADIEKSIGAEFEVKVTPVISAMSSLAKGLVDGIIVGTDPKEFLNEFNSENEKKGIAAEKIENYQWHEIANGRVKLGVHPQNPIDKLSKEQITDILFGKLKTWETINGQKHNIVLLVPTAYVLTVKSMMQFYLKKDTSPVAQLVRDKDGALKGLELNPGGIAVLVSKDKSPTIEPKYFETEATFPIFLLIKKDSKKSAVKAYEFLKSMPKLSL